MRYAISYDLIAPGKNYQQLWDAIARLGAQRVLLSEWVTTQRTGTSATAVRDYLRPFIDSTDRLFVKCLDNNEWVIWFQLADPNTI